MQQNKEYKAIRTKEAATGGLVMGVLLFAILLLDYFTAISSTNVSVFIGIANIMAVASVITIFTKRYAILCGNKGLSYGESYGFIIIMMIFAGVIYGSLYFVQTNMVDPQYYDGIQSQIIINNDKLTEAERDMALKMLDKSMKNPILVIMSSVISTILYGALLGLVIAVFTKKDAQRAEDCSNQEEQSIENNEEKSN